MGSLRQFNTARLALKIFPRWNCSADKKSSGAPELLSRGDFAEVIFSKRAAEEL